MSPRAQFALSGLAALGLGVLLLFSDWTGVSAITLVVNALVLAAFVANVYLAWAAWRRMR